MDALDGRRVRDLGESTEGALVVGREEDQGRRPGKLTFRTREAREEPTGETEGLSRLSGVVKPRGGEHLLFGWLSHPVLCVRTKLFLKEWGEGCSSRVT